MARTADTLSASEEIMVGELNGIANNSVIYKDNGGVYQRVALGADGTVLTSGGATSAPAFESVIVTPRIVTTTDDATAVIDVTITDQYELTAMANPTTISTTGTGVAGQKLIIRLKDNATPRALTWDGIFVAVGVTLPTTTVASKLTYVGCIYNATATKWDVVAVTTEV